MRTLSLALMALAATCAFASPSVADKAPAGSNILGTLKATGPVWVGSDDLNWSPLERTRPLVAGDRLRTDSGGSLLADLGRSGTFALVPDTQVAVSVESDVARVHLKKGLVAFTAPDEDGLIVSSGDMRVAVLVPATRGVVVSDGSSVLLRVDAGAVSVVVPDGVSEVSAGKELLLAEGRSTAQAAAAKASGSNRADDLADWAREHLGRASWSALSVFGAVAVGVAVVIDDDDASPSD